MWLTTSTGSQSKAQAQAVGVTVPVLQDVIAGFPDVADLGVLADVADELDELGAVAAAREGEPEQTHVGDRVPAPVVELLACLSAGEGPPHQVGAGLHHPGPPLCHGLVVPQDVPVAVAQVGRARHLLVDQQAQRAAEPGVEFP